MKKTNLVVGGSIIVIVFAAALIGAIGTPYDPTQIDAADRLAPPSWSHWFGCDEWGRDVFSRTLSGAAITVAIAGLTTLLATGAGTIVGVSAGFLGGWLDKAVVAVMDALLAFPALVLAIAMTTLLSGASLAPVIALSVAYVPYVVRVVRTGVLTIRQADYITASSIMGNSAAYTLARHVAPNVVGLVTVISTAIFGWALLAESALSFLGLGLPPPAASWGGMLSDSRNYFADAPWLAVVPGLAISISLLGVNLLGDGCRDLLDPRTKRA